MKTLSRLAGAVILVVAGALVAMFSIGTWLAIGINEGLGEGDAPLNGYGILTAGLLAALVLFGVAIYVAWPRRRA